jgi:hypothetical protein
MDGEQIIELLPSHYSMRSAHQLRISTANAMVQLPGGLS